MSNTTPRLPSSWRWGSLGEVADYFNGRPFKPSEWESSGRPIVRIQNLTGSTDEVHYYSGPVAERNLVREGDLLVSWSATLNAFFWHGPEAVLNQHIFKVIPRVDKNFLYLAFKFI